MVRVFNSVLRFILNQTEGEYPVATAAVPHSLSVPTIGSCFCVRPQKKKQLLEYVRTRTSYESYVHTHEKRVSTRNKMLMARTRHKHILKTIHTSGCEYEQGSLRLSALVSKAPCLCSNAQDDCHSSQKRNELMKDDSSITILPY